MHPVGTGDAGLCPLKATGDPGMLYHIHRPLLLFHRFTEHGDKGSGPPGPSLHSSPLPSWTPVGWGSSFLLEASHHGAGGTDPGLIPVLGLAGQYLLFSWSCDWFKKIDSRQCDVISSIDISGIRKMFLG